MELNEDETLLTIDEELNEVESLLAKVGVC
jgi:hypothetical protein